MARDPTKTSARDRDLERREDSLLQVRLFQAARELSVRGEIGDEEIPHLDGGPTTRAAPGGFSRRSELGRPAPRHLGLRGMVRGAGRPDPLGEIPAGVLTCEPSAGLDLARGHLQVDHLLPLLQELLQNHGPKIHAPSPPEQALFGFKTHRYAP